MNIDQEIVEMMRFLDPEIVEKVDKSFMLYFPRGGVGWDGDNQT